MNKRKHFIILLIILCLTLTISGTIGYFKIGVEAFIKANVANYTLNISGESISNQTINLGNSLKPYDKGYFTINLILKGTETDVLTTVSIERVNLPKGFKFLAVDDNISPFSTYSKMFKASNSTKTDTITVYWYWDGDVDDESDNAFINQTLSANIIIKSKQMNGTMMKNGNSSSVSSRTEFWSDKYSQYIRTITFLNNLSNLPKVCNEENLCWDISYSSFQKKKVYAYLLDSGLDYIDSNSVSYDLYNLYIVSELPIYAPYNSSYLFCGFTKLESIKFNNNFDTSNVTNMSYMFMNCWKLTDLDMSDFNTSNVRNMSYMFRSCSKLTSLDVSSFNTASVTNMSYMFDGFSSLTRLDLSSFNTARVTNMSGMFQGSSKLTILDLSSFNTSKVTNMYIMFNSCYSLISIYLNSFNTSKVTNMNYMFRGCSSLTNLDLNSFDTSNITNMDNMFSSCSSLTSLDLSSFNTSNVTNMQNMFEKCSSLRSLDLSNFDTSNVTNMRDMFRGCSVLTSLDLSNFNTSKVTDMYEMFQSCSSLTNLDLSSFNTSSVTAMNFMFSGCRSLITTINIMKSSGTSYSYMFNGAATSEGALITVNYIADASTLVDKMIATKSTNSNVVKGTVIS